MRRILIGGEMYDRDYVKSLERELELTNGNRFRGWSALEQPLTEQTAKTAESPRGQEAPENEAHPESQAR